MPEEPEGEYYLLHPFLVLQGFVEVDILDFRHEPIARLTYHAGDSCFSRGLLRQNIVKVHEHTELMVGDFGAFQEFAGPRARTSPRFAWAVMTGVCCGALSAQGSVLP